MNPHEVFKLICGNDGEVVSFQDDGETFYSGDEFEGDGRAYVGICPKCGNRIHVEVFKKEAA